MKVVNYFNKLSNYRTTLMIVLRNLIKKVFPDLDENLYFNMPIYGKDKIPLFAMASQKNYIYFYVMNYSLLGDFKEDLETYNFSKSCIRFKNISDEELKFLEKILIKIKNYYFQK